MSWGKIKEIEKGQEDLQVEPRAHIQVIISTVIPPATYEKKVL